MQSKSRMTFLLVLHQGECSQFSKALNSVLDKILAVWINLEVKIVDLFCDYLVSP